MQRGCMVNVLFVIDWLIFLSFSGSDEDDRDGIKGIGYLGGTLFQLVFALVKTRNCMDL